MGDLTVNLCRHLTYLYKTLSDHCDVKSPMTIVGDLIFMVGYLTKADYPTFDNMVYQISTIAPLVPEWGVVGEYIDRCIKILNLVRTLRTPRDNYSNCKTVANIIIL